MIIENIHINSIEKIKLDDISIPKEIKFQRHSVCFDIYEQIQLLATFDTKVKMKD